LMLKKAGDRIIAAAKMQEDLRGMGTTLTAVQLCNNSAVWAHAGDSRLYCFSKGTLHQVTRDHRFLQELIDSGEMSPEEALDHPLRNFLDQCLGSPDVQPDYGSFTIDHQDTLILTTDGLHDYVRPDRLITVLGSSASFPEMADTLISKALESGSTDNVSIVFARMNGH
jgi:PPM family protein phosphatase